VFDEAVGLVSFAGDLRRQLSGDLKGIYWNSRWRTIYVLLDRGAMADRHVLRREKLIAAERAVVKAYEASVDSKQSNGADQPADSLSNQLQSADVQNARLCFDLPAMPLVPVDDASMKRPRARGSSVRKVPRLLELAWPSRVPLLAALFSMGSAGVAGAKLPSIEQSGMVRGVSVPAAASTVAARDLTKEADNLGDGAEPSLYSGREPFLGGPGLHLFWRDPIFDAVGQKAALESFPLETVPLGPKTEASAGSGDAVTRKQVTEASRSGATFGALAGVTDRRALDLKWLADDEPIFGKSLSQSRAVPMMLSGVAAVLGLSRLMRNDPSAEAYPTALEDVQLHFGLPRSLQIETRWHFARMEHSSVSNDDVSGGRLRTEQNDSYWEWLRRVELKRSTVTGDDRYRSHNVLEAQFRPSTSQPGSSSD
jgi:hypothetical protein